LDSHPEGSQYHEEQGGREDHQSLIHLWFPWAAGRGLSDSGYNPSKAAVEILTKNLAVKLGRYKIYVNCIAPGFFRTDMMEHLFKPEMKQLLDKTVEEIPLNIYGEADHIKGLAVFLASKASDYVSGAVIPVDGGRGAM
jgi:gluconate 5-dehydrogenase